jgi:rhamnulokinase
MGMTAPSRASCARCFISKRREAAVRAFHAAIDLGAGSGRVFVGTAAPDAVGVRELHRFHYAPRPLDGHLRWDMPRLVEGLRIGLHHADEAARTGGGELISVGVDGWGVDYGLLDDEGRLIEEPICYRDERTTGVMEGVFARVPRETIFAATGIQLLPFNTLFQLAAHVSAGLPARAARLLLIPDLCHQLLCGSVVSEVTNASTTQLLNVRGADWNDDLFERLGLPRGLMPALVPAGSEIGCLRRDLMATLDLPPLRVVAPATHDTASAVLGTPLASGWAYISSGTWSLVGVERDAPLVDARVFAANFTNERGAGGTIRFLKNVMGLWLLESCRREWACAGACDSLDQLLARVGAPSEPSALIYPDAARFFSPLSMTRELTAALVETGQPATADPAALTAIILDSLALRYASVITTLEVLTGQSIEGIHIIGGGALNTYLNQATANAAGRPVLAGPIEATAVGNLLVQAVACGTLSELGEGRRAIAATAALAPRRFEPQHSRAWKEAAARYRELELASAAP